MGGLGHKADGHGHKKIMYMDTEKDVHAHP